MVDPLTTVVRHAISNAFWADLPDQVLPGTNFGPAFDGMAKTAVDALLSPSSGVGVVELPEPDDFGHWDILSCGEFNGVESTGDSVVCVDITEYGIETETCGELTPLEAELFAAALLAALAETRSHE